MNINRPGISITALALFAIAITVGGIVRFDTKDEMQDALKTLRSQDKEFIALRYHNQLEQYVQYEVGL